MLKSKQRQLKYNEQENIAFVNSLHQFVDHTSNIPTILAKVRGNALMVFDVRCEKGLYATFQRGI